MCTRDPFIAAVCQLQHPPPPDVSELSQFSYGALVLVPGQWLLCEDADRATTLVTLHRLCRTADANVYLLCMEWDVSVADAACDGGVYRVPCSAYSEDRFVQKVRALDQHLWQALTLDVLGDECILQPQF